MDEEHRDRLPAAVSRIFENQLLGTCFDDSQSLLALAARGDEHAKVKLLDGDTLTNREAVEVDTHPWPFLGSILCLCHTHPVFMGACILLKQVGGVKPIVVRHPLFSRSTRNGGVLDRRLRKITTGSTGRPVVYPAEGAGIWRLVQ